MQLSFAEKLQILRKRKGLNQGVFGAKAFNLPLDSGRTKVKNIELGKQHPSEQEIGQMAQILGVSADFMQLQGEEAGPGQGGDLSVSPKVLDRFPRLGAYLEMLNKAVSLEDDALITHIGASLAEIFEPREEPIVKRIK